VPLFYFYDSLVLLSLQLDASNSEKQAAKLWLTTKKDAKWANHAPMNYLHKFHLVERQES